MSKKRPKKRRFNFSSEARLVPFPVVTDYFEPEPGMEYEDVPEELHTRIACFLALDEYEKFGHAPIGSGSIRKYIYGEARKHSPKCEYTVVIKRKKGFEHIYLTREQARERVEKLIEAGHVRAEDVDKDLLRGAS